MKVSSNVKIAIVNSGDLNICISPLQYTNMCYRCDKYDRCKARRVNWRYSALSYVHRNLSTARKYVRGKMKRMLGE